jgi:hypothetical protein
MAERNTLYAQWQAARATVAELQNFASALSRPLPGHSMRHLDLPAAAVRVVKWGERRVARHPGAATLASDAGAAVRAGLEVTIQMP